MLPSPVAETKNVPLRLPNAMPSGLPCCGSESVRVWAGHARRLTGVTQPPRRCHTSRSPNDGGEGRATGMAGHRGDSGGGGAGRRRLGRLRRPWARRRERERRRRQRRAARASWRGRRAGRRPRPGRAARRRPAPRPGRRRPAPPRRPRSMLSRGVSSPSCGGAPADGHDGRTPRSGDASHSARTASRPSATTRIAATSCSSGASLSRKPLAPARSAS